MAYKRKTQDEYQIHTDNGYGFEEVTSEDTWKAARAQLKCYRENQSEYPHKIVKKRIPLGNSGEVSTSHD